MSAFPGGRWRSSPPERAPQRSFSGRGQKWDRGTGRRRARAWPVLGTLPGLHPVPAFREAAADGTKRHRRSAAPRSQKPVAAPSSPARRSGRSTRRARRSARPRTGRSRPRWRAGRASIARAFKKAFSSRWRSPPRPHRRPPRTPAPPPPPTGKGCPHLHQLMGILAGQYQFSYI